MSERVFVPPRGGATNSRRQAASLKLLKELRRTDVAMAERALVDIERSEASPAYKRAARKIVAGRSR